MDWIKAMRPDISMEHIADLVADAHEFERVTTVFDCLHELVVCPKLRLTTQEQSQLGLSAAATGLAIVRAVREDGSVCAGIDIRIKEWEFSRHHQLVLPEYISDVPLSVTVQGEVFAASARPIEDGSK